MLDNLFDELEKSYLFDKKHNTILSIIEGASAILAGGFIGNYISQLKLHQLILFIVFLLLFAYLFYRRLSKESSFSVSGLGELKSTIGLNAAVKEIERKNLIDDYIDGAVKALNENTCNYNEYNVNNNLCDQSITNGLRSVYQPYFENLQNLLTTAKAKFTVGAYLNYILKLPPNFGLEHGNVFSDHDVLVPRDDLNFAGYFVKDMLHNPDLTGLSFFIQHQLQDSFKHERFVHSIFQEQDKSYSLITAPIPTVCEDGSFGVFFMISKELATIPDDIENVTQIFSRLFSNWLSKYNDCVIGRCDSTNKLLLTKGNVQVPPKVTALMQSNQQSNGAHDQS